MLDLASGSHFETMEFAAHAKHTSDSVAQAPWTLEAIGPSCFVLLHSFGFAAGPYSCAGLRGGAGLSQAYRPMQVEEPFGLTTSFLDWLQSRAGTSEAAPVFAGGPNFSNFSEEEQKAGHISCSDLMQKALM